MKITAFIFDIICEIVNDDSFIKEFKKFANDSYPILHLCSIYEEGTGKKINEKSINTVINFIKDSIPLLKEIGTDIHNFDNDMLSNLILDFYIPIKESYLKEVN